MTMPIFFLMEQPDPVGGRSRCAGWLIRIMIVSVFTVLALAPTACHAATEVTWPVPKLPDDMTTFAMGQAMTVNGLPMRLQGFMSRQRPAALLQELRRSLGQPLVESTSGSKRILGRAEGRFYLTVQVEASGHGSKGIVSMADLGALGSNHDAIERVKSHWLDRLPAGSTIASDMLSEDGGKAARHMVILNGLGPAYNRDAVVSLLAGDGYVLEREDGSASTSLAAISANSSGAITLHFRAAGKEAMAVITRTGSSTVIVMNTVTALKASE